MAVDNQDKNSLISPLERSEEGKAVCTAKDISVTDETGIGETNLHTHLVGQDIAINSKPTVAEVLPDPTPVSEGSVYLVDGDHFTNIVKGTSEHTIEAVLQTIDLGGTEGTFTGLVVNGLQDFPPIGRTVWNPTTVHATAEHAIGAMGFRTPHRVPGAPAQTERTVLVYISKHSYEEAKGSAVASGDQLRWVADDGSNSASFLLDYASTTVVFSSNGEADYLVFTATRHDLASDSAFQTLKGFAGHDTTNLFYVGTGLLNSDRVFDFATATKGWRRDDPVLAREDAAEIEKLKNESNAQKIVIETLQENLANQGDSIADINAELRSVALKSSIQINEAPGPFEGGTLHGREHDRVDIAAGTVEQDHLLVDSLVYRKSENLNQEMNIIADVAVEIAKQGNVVTTSGSLQNVELYLVRERGDQREYLQKLFTINSTLAEWNAILCGGGSCLPANTYRDFTAKNGTINIVYDFANTDNLQTGDKLVIEGLFRSINGFSSMILTLSRSGSNPVFSLSAV